MQELLEEVRGASHLLPLLPVLSQRRGQGQGEDEDSQQGILLPVSYGYAVDTSVVVIPLPEPVPELDFGHFLRFCNSSSNSNSSP